MKVLGRKISPSIMLKPTSLFSRNSKVNILTSVKDMFGLRKPMRRVQEKII